MIEVFSAAPIENSQPRTSEIFISLPAVKKLVGFAILSRVDPVTQKLLPLEENYAISHADGSLSPRPSNWRTDIVFPPAESIKEPTHDGGLLHTSWLYNLSEEIYNRLIFKKTVQLSAIDVEKLKTSEQALEQTLDANPYFTWRKHLDQIQDAYHIKKGDSSILGTDPEVISPLRIYINGAGIFAVDITNYVLTHNGNFATIKTWVPSKTTAPQGVREDAPIFQVNTTDQLHSVIAILRNMTQEKVFPPIDPKTASPLGIPIFGIPGAYLIQMRNEFCSPNSDLADFWAEPIREAASAIPLPEDLIITPEWIDNVAVLALTIGKKNAAGKGINPDSHALLAEQDIDVIMDAIR